MNNIIEIWRGSLEQLLNFYETNRGPFIIFFPMLFLFFIIINLLCYWLAMFTAFPDLTYGSAGLHYFKVQFPVGFLGALFDTLSFFVTLFIIRRAIRSRSGMEYVAHLSIDVIIALLATLWLLFVFSFSGWLVHLWENTPQDLIVRNAKYQRMLTNAIADPVDNTRNIYFGLVMGISATIPTCTHIFMFLRASWATIATPSNKRLG